MGEDKSSGHAAWVQLYPRILIELTRCTISSLLLLLWFRGLKNTTRPLLVVWTLIIDAIEYNHHQGIDYPPLLSVAGCSSRSDCPPPPTFNSVSHSPLSTPVAVVPCCSSVQSCLSSEAMHSSDSGCSGI